MVGVVGFGVWELAGGLFGGICRVGVLEMGGDGVPDSTPLGPHAQASNASDTRSAQNFALAFPFSL